MSAPAALAEAPASASAPDIHRRPGGLTRLARLDALVWPTLLIAAVLCLVTFIAGGGLELESMTKVEMGLTVLCGLSIAALIVLAAARVRNYGVSTVGLLLAFAALSALSVVWSVAPDESFRDAGRMLAYCAVFGCSVALARSLSSRWPAVLGGVILAAAIVCGYALATKVFPAQLDPSDTYARLQQPYGYWNAIGLTASMGVIGALWLGARRGGHALLSALAYPAMGLFLVTLMLAYSRGALAALAIGALVWFCLVPLRLRGAAVGLLGALGAGAVVAWDFSRPALSQENVALSTRTLAGHQLGAALLAMLVALTLVGVAIGFRTARRAPSIRTRRRAGALLLGLIVIVVLAGAGALAHSHRGLFGSVSHAVESLTNPNAPVPPNTPGRLTAISSVRARYWKEALEVFQAHPLLGAGAAGYGTARLRYRTETLEVRHAHGFIVQTLADLGLVGLVLTLALLASWMVAAGRSTHPLGRRWSQWRWQRYALPYSAERIGMLSLLCVVVVFGVHSFVDWTWYIPGNACVALLCAGWLAGRGTLEDPHTDPSDERTIARWGASARRTIRLPSLAEIGPVRALVAGAVLVASTLAVWVQWQPQRSVDASERALALVEAHQTAAALIEAQNAVNRDPLSAEALFHLAAVQQSAGQEAQARQTLARSVHSQPSNPQTWQTLGEYDLKAANTQMARNELRAAVFLNPQSVEAQNAFVLALRAPVRNPVEGHKALIKSARAGHLRAVSRASAGRRQA